RRYLAVARPFEENNVRFGVFAVAKPRAELQAQWVTLLQRLLFGIVGGLLAVPTDLRPDARARGRRRPDRGGPLRRRDPRHSVGRRDRAPRRALSGDGRAPRRGRRAGAQLPDVRLARAAHPADRDPRPRRRPTGGRRRGPGAPERV